MALCVFAGVGDGVWAAGLRECGLENKRAWARISPAHPEGARELICGDVFFHGKHLGPGEKNRSGLTRKSGCEERELGSLGPRRRCAVHISIRADLINVQ